MTPVRKGNIYSSSDRYGRFQVKVLATMIDLKGKAKIVIQRLPKTGKRILYPPKLVTPCYLCHYKLEGNEQ